MTNLKCHLLKNLHFEEVILQDCLPLSTGKQKLKKTRWFDKCRLSNALNFSMMCNFFLKLKWFHGESIITMEMWYIMEIGSKYQSLITFSEKRQNLTHRLFDTSCILESKVLMQGKLFQRCTHFLYCSLGEKVNTRRMSHPDKESIFTQIIYEIFWS